MSKYSEQIQRIKTKLIQAKKADPSFKVFGAGSHKYTLNAPISKQEINEFENQYSIQLPECYKTFILEIGNGGSSFNHSGAGPYYGIYPLGEGVNDLLYEDAEKYLKNECVLYPKMTDEYWNELNSPLNDEDEENSDDTYSDKLGEIFGGVLPIGSQGCTYLHGIILNGKHTGKVVNLDMDRHKPQFTYENNFLDWYERWLDEVISGDLVTDDATWFGYNMGGTEEALFEGYIQSNNPDDQNDHLYGLMSKRKVKPSTIEKMDQWIQSNPIENNKNLVQLLCKFDYQRAKPHLITLANVDLLASLQGIYWYAKKRCNEWTTLIEQKINDIQDEETFSIVISVLTETKMDYGKLIIPFTQHPNDKFRQLSFYALGQLKNKAEYLDQFITGLNDESNWVIHATLQALEGVKNNKLLEHYKKVAQRFPVETDYILSNLNGRLSDYGLNNESILK